MQADSYMLIIIDILNNKNYYLHIFKANYVENQELLMCLQKQLQQQY